MQCGIATIFVLGIIIFHADIVDVMNYNKPLVFSGSVVTPTKNVKPMKGMLILKTDLLDIDLHVILKEFETSFPNLRRDLLKENIDLSSCSHMLPLNTRKKRAAFDFGGDILKHIFGVATTKDMNKYQSHVETNLEIHTLEIENLLKFSNETHNTLSYLKNGFRTFVAQLGEYTERQTKINALFRVQNLCNELFRFRLNIELNHINLKQFNSKIIFKEISSFAHKWDLKTLFPTSDIKFIKTINSKIINEGHKKYALLIIPFFASTYFHGYEIRGFAMYTNQSAKFKIINKIKHTLVLISDEQSKIALLNKEFLNACPISVDNILVCPNFPTQKRSKALDTVCEISLIIKNDSSTCEFEKFRYPMQFFHYKNFLVISGEPHSSISLYCDFEPSNMLRNIIHKNPVVTLPRTGIIVLPAVCAMESEQFSYTPTKRRQLKKSFFIPWVPPKAMLYINHTHPASDLVRKIENSLNKSKKFLTVPKTNDENWHKQILIPTVTSGVTIVIISVTMLCVVILVRIIKKRMKVRNEKSKNTEPTDKSESY